MHAVTTIRELGPEEISLVGGAWTWEKLSAVMIAGAIVGGLGGFIATGGPGAVPGAIGGAILGGMGYLIQDYILYLLANPDAPLF